MKGGRKVMIYLTTQSTLVIYGHIAKNHSDKERKPAAATTWATLSD